MFNLFCRCCERRSSSVAKLVLSVDKRHIRETDKAQYVAQIGFLKIEPLSGRVFFVRAPARRDDNNLLVSE
jgi:hypothetical protein